MSKKYYDQDKANMSRKPSQLQLFYQEQKKLGEANELFMELVKDGMTREDLQVNIDRRPQLWERYADWLKVLPSRDDWQHNEIQDDEIHDTEELTQEPKPDRYEKTTTINYWWKSQDGSEITPAVIEELDEYAEAKIAAKMLDGFTEGELDALARLTPDESGHFRGYYTIRKA
jgi:hypothetical protein